MNAVTKVHTPDAEIMEAVLADGDLSRLSPSQRVNYYFAVCTSRGLNPLTRPFDYIKLNGKLVLYAKRDCTDQLRNLDGISVQITSRSTEDDLYIVTARATDARGRSDEDYGAVSVKGLVGEARANALMKALTKAKRRVTLSICGMGMNDESEVEGIPGAVIERADLRPVETYEHAPAQQAIAPPAAPITDKQRDAVDRLEARIDACEVEDDLHKITMDAAISAWRTRLAAQRPELDTRIADALGAKYEALTAGRLDDAMAEAGDEAETAKSQSDLRERSDLREEPA